jgi:hypothetical protein
VSRDAEDFAVESVDNPPFGPAQARRVLDEGVQHGLEIKGGATDHFEDFAHGGLLLVSFGELPGPLRQVGLRLLELGALR